MSAYRVFTRRSWSGSKREGFRPAPCPPGNTVAVVDTIQEARDMCAQGAGNIARASGKEYRHLTMREFEVSA